MLCTDPPGYHRLLQTYVAGYGTVSEVLKKGQKRAALHEQLESHIRHGGNADRCG